MLHSETVGIRKPGPRARETKHIATELTIMLCYQTPDVLTEGRATQAAFLTCHGGRGKFLLL